MFPIYINGARVVCFTSKDDYGAAKKESGTKAVRVTYLAICKYENEDSYFFVWM